jgi:hypothetical protein
LRRIKPGDGCQAEHAHADQTSDRLQPESVVKCAVRGLVIPRGGRRSRGVPENVCQQRLLAFLALLFALQRAFLRERVLRLLPLFPFSIQALAHYLTLAK